VERIKLVRVKISAEFLWTR